MIEQVEKQFTPIEAFPVESPEVGTQENTFSVDTNKQSSLQSVEVQTPVQSAQEHVSVQSASPDRIVTTGDRWNETIKNKKLGVAPLVL